MNVSDLRGILTYVPQFREKVFVIAIDGAIAAHENFPNILLDIAVLRSLNIRVVIVHGIAKQMEDLAASSGVALSNIDGTGTTDEATLAVALTAANRVTHEIMEGLAANDLRACYSNAVIAHPFGIIGGVDRQFTGRVERLDTAFLNELLDRGIIPVVPPLGFDGEGRTYRVNSDGVAQTIAEELRAGKLIYLSPQPGLLRGEGLISQMSVLEAEEFFKKSRNEIDEGLRSKVEHGIRACKNGVGRSHILDGRRDEAILGEVFSKVGIGTMIYANEYTAIRRALKKDVSRILALTEESVQTQGLVKRTRAGILAQLSDYYVFEIDRSIAGCVALHVHPEEKKAEMACLHVSHAHENQGIGRKLMLFVEDLAKEKGAAELFALSTQAFNFFQQKGGFREVAPDFLPAERREKYENSGRNSKILAKHLTAGG
ncbi:N-acetylglutamate synthase [Verrucomicrobium sp. GAS474]|uniref:amino-acid N-acetyltransferase n=1 Tax=Verrucomicrobium sp. GAS474 TaxID=1882831 RepID=UPI00087A0566|nr:amino-acid N-acetyltransferase [Verrucomicrobium sp. GAS474]SDT99849.1 N-acetylglutamate synthase [Verrucomicrobium sp. GAS474]